MKKVIIYSLALFTVTSCGGNSHSIEKKDASKVTSNAVAGDMSDEEFAKEVAEYKKQEEERVAAEKANQTTISFDKKIHDYGNVLPEVENFTTFTVTNTGDKPLIIEDVSASCGCTTPKKPEGPIAPGESDVIEVVFKSKPGQLNEVTKTVTVTANTSEKVHKLEIKAFVKG